MILANTVSYPKTGPVNPAKLHRDVAAAIPVPALVGVHVDGEIQIEFDAPLPAPDKVTLDGIVAAHPGFDTLVKFHASATIVPGTLPVVTDAPLWQSVGVVTTNPGFFISDLATAKGRLVAQVKTNLQGAKLRVVENGVEPEVVVGEFDVENTAGAWAFVKFFTVVPPRTGDHLYRVEAQKPLLSLFDIRGLSISLLEFITVPGA